MRRIRIGLYNYSLWYWLGTLVALQVVTVAASSHRSSSSSSHHPHQQEHSVRLPGNPYEVDTDNESEMRPTNNDNDNGGTNNGNADGISSNFWKGVKGTGREFNIFDSRGGENGSNVGGGSGAGSDGRRYRNASDNTARPASNRDNGSSGNNPSNSSRRSSYSDRDHRSGPPSYSSTGGRFNRGTSYFRDQHRNRQKNQHRTFLSPVTDWWTSSISPNIKNWPKIQCRVEPTTTLKIRKTFRPLKLTVVRLGADFNTQLGVWQFKSSWEDEIIGGKLTLAGRELQLTKSWQLSVGAMEDLVTRLRFRAAVDLQTWKAYARVGFRTERLSPMNVVEGFTVFQQLPLDGNKGHVKLEVKANFALPEPEIEYSTETQRSLIGMGDIEVSIEELNLVLDY
jgi:hypothetical protein